MSVRVGDLVMVVWTDASFSLDDDPTVTEMETVGWVTRSTHMEIVVAAERDFEIVRARTAIPVCCIRQIFRLEVVRDSGD